MKRFALLLLVLAACSTTGGSLEGPPVVTPSVSEGPGRPVGTTNQFPIQWDATAGKLMLQISRFGDEFLYVVSLPAVASH